MSYGILIRNSSGEIIIDESNPVFSLVSAGQFSVPSGYKFARDYGGWDIEQKYLEEKVVYLPTNGAANVVAFVSPSRGQEVGVVGVRNEPSNNRLAISLVSETGASARVEAYVYGGHLNFPAGEDYGLQVLDASGGLVFDSRRPPLSIDSFRAIPFSITLPSGDSHSPVGCEATGLAKTTNSENDGYIAVYTYFARWDGGTLNSYNKLVYYINNTTDLGGAPAPTEHYYTYSVTSGGVDVGSVTLNKQNLGVNI